MTTIPLSDIEDGPNIRTVALPVSAEEALAASIAADGVLTPILVRPAAPAPGSNRPRYQVILGSRRVRAARAAGLADIPAELRDMTDAQVRMAQMGDQALRRSLHAVDQWRAVRTIVETDGYTPAIAARALGLDERVVRRMDRIGRLPPTALKLCEIELPSDWQLTRLLRAEPKSVVAATKSLKGLIRQVNGTDGVDWNTIVNRTSAVSRIWRSAAIFDTATAGVAWEEDLFADPGENPDTFFTTQVDRFIAAQRAALAARYQKAKKHRVVDADATGRDPMIPRGFTPSWGGTRDRPGAHEMTFWCVRSDGTIGGTVTTDVAAKREAEKTTKKVTVPAAADERIDGDAQTDRLDDPDDGEPADAVETATGLTKAGMALIHKAKTDALREAIRMRDIEAHDLLLFFVLAIGADNVRVQGFQHTAVDLRAIAKRFVSPSGGSTAPDDAEIRRAAQDVLAAMLRIGTTTASYDNFSGAPAEWIGAMLSAGDYLAPFDTEAFLRECRGPQLRQAAERGGVKWAGSGKAMRARLNGQSPDWRPEAATFGAAGPR